MLNSQITDRYEPDEDDIAPSEKRPRKTSAGGYENTKSKHKKRDKYWGEVFARSSRERDREREQTRERELSRKRPAGGAQVLLGMLVAEPLVCRRLPHSLPSRDSSILHKSTPNLH